MELWCKHLAVRLWVALFLGGVASLAILPPFAGAFGPEWMVIPGLCFLVLAYWLTGVGFAAMGHRRIDRLMDEAKVWERAGMPREVRNVLAKALNTLDSFLFSPPARKGPAKRLLAQTARFQMAQSVTDMPSDDVIEAYLFSFPNDQEVAVKWLDGVLAGETVSRHTFELVGRLKEANEQDTLILQMVVRFFVRERCCDLTALQTYGQLMDTQTPIPNDLIQGMTDLFLSQSRADRLALNVYLMCYQGGGRHSLLMQGIAACGLSIRPGPLTKHLLEAADSALANIQKTDRIRMAESFFPESEERSSVRSQKRFWNLQSAILPLLKNGWKGVISNARRTGAAFSCQWQKIRVRLQSARIKRIAKWVTLYLFIAGVTLFIINTILHLSTPSKIVEKTPIPVVTPVTDPFTIQVAAYLKERDAKRYVKQLIENEMDAYWTQASGGGKNWYQVRVSHFKTKAEAKAFGEALKRQGIIDDYYIANYTGRDR